MLPELLQHIAQVSRLAGGRHGGGPLSVDCGPLLKNPSLCSSTL
jgi:hypothetical protein